jgi:4'-phosphopantetheinyl transferase
VTARSRRPCPPEEVRVWLAPLGPASAAAAAVCTDAERARAARLPRPIDRDQRLVTRGILRHLLAACTGTDPAAVPLEASATGKPVLAGSSDVRFSVAHSGALAAVAVATREVGIDLERCDPRLDVGAVSRAFPHREAQALLALPPVERRAAFFRSWCRKEAYLKATGTGWTVPVDHLPDELRFDQSASPPLDMATPFGQWRVVDLPAGEGYACSVVAEGRDWTVPPVMRFVLAP